MKEKNLLGNKNIEFIKIPLGTEAHRYAEEFAIEQRNPQKGKQVYLNTLAVYAVNRYLNWLNVRTDLNQSNSWQSGTRMLFNVVDLFLPGVGKLECCPVLPDEEILYLPEEIRHDCIGYVAVKFSQELNQVELLGFLPVNYINSSSKKIPLDKLHSLNDLIEHLNPLESENLVAVVLREWLKRKYPPDWFSPSDLILTPSFKNISPAVLQPSSVRAKKINLGGKLAKRTLALVIHLSPNDTEDVEIQVYLYPTKSSFYNNLPSDISLIIVDEQDSNFMNAQTRRFDESLCLRFSGKIGEKFGIRIVFEDTFVMENFVI